MGGPTTTLAVSKRVQEPTVSHGRGDKRGPRVDSNLPFPGVARACSWGGIHFAFTYPHDHEAPWALARALRQLAWWWDRPQSRLKRPVAPRTEPRLGRSTAVLKWH